MAAASQARVRISGTELSVGQWLAEPLLPNLERLMTVVTALGGPVIDLDGMRLPLLRQSRFTQNELRHATLHAFNREARWRSSSKPEDERPTIYPGRYLRFRLEASYLARIVGLSTLGVRDHLRLMDEPEWKGTKDEPSRTRSRSADRVMTQGDKAWAMLGAWPYDVYGERRLPVDWRRRPETSEALAEYVNRARRCAHIHSAAS